MSPRLHLDTLILIAVSSCAAFAACGDEGGTTGTHIGNPPSGLAITVTSSLQTEGASGVDFADDRDVVYTLSHARISLRDIELDLPSELDCADVEADLQEARCDQTSRKVIVDGPFAVDLLNQTSTPSLDGVRLPAVTWKRVDFRIDDGREDELPAGDELIDRSFVARADFTEPGGSQAQLHVNLRFNEDARFESDQGVSVPPGGLLRLELDAATWLQGAPLGECLEEGDLAIENGVLLVDDDEGGCSDVEDALKDNIKNSTRLRGEER